MIRESADDVGFGDLADQVLRAQGVALRAEAVLGRGRQRCDQPVGDQQALVVFGRVSEIEDDIPDAGFAVEFRSRKNRLVDNQRYRRTEQDLVAVIERERQARLKQDRRAGLPVGIG